MRRHGKEAKRRGHTTAGAAGGRAMVGVGVVVVGGGLAGVGVTFALRGGGKLFTTRFSNA